MPKVTKHPEKAPGIHFTCGQPLLKFSWNPDTTCSASQISPSHNHGEAALKLLQSIFQLGMLFFFFPTAKTQEIIHFLPDFVALCSE